jgi:hypothetical protein
MRKLVTLLLFLYFSICNAINYAKNENQRRVLFQYDKGGGEGIDIDTLRLVTCEHSIPSPSCRGGMCRFYNCNNAPSCRGGGCYFENCIDATCEGGGCFFKLCERPTCSGGGCDFTENRDILKKGFCEGGGCTYDGYSMSSEVEAAI